MKMNKIEKGQKRKKEKLKESWFQEGRWRVRRVGKGGRLEEEEEEEEEQTLPNKALCPRKTVFAAKLY